jgi:hypothetical protein
MTSVHLAGLNNPIPVPAAELEGGRRPVDITLIFGGTRWYPDRRLSFRLRTFMDAHPDLNMKPLNLHRIYVQ